MIFESHSHTPLCKHADGHPTEYAAVAHQKGLIGLHVTCHNPMPNGFSSAVRMAESEFDLYVDMVAQATEQWRGRVDVRLGLEADYFEGYESYLEQQLSRAEFHFVLGSVHPQIQEFQDTYWRDDPIEVQRIYFDLLAKSAETGLFDSLAHPDLIKNYTRDHWNPSNILDIVRPALDRIAKTGVAMELNTSGVLKRLPEMNPCPEILHEMLERDIPVTLGADAHTPTRVGDGYEDAMKLLQQVGFTHVNYFLQRQRQSVAIDDVLESFSVGTAPDATSGSPRS